MFDGAGSIRRNHLHCNSFRLCFVVVAVVTVVAVALCRLLLARRSCTLLHLFARHLCDSLTGSECTRTQDKQASNDAVRPSSRRLAPLPIVHSVIVILRALRSHNRNALFASYFVPPFLSAAESPSRWPRSPLARNMHLIRLHLWPRLARARFIFFSFFRSRPEIIAGCTECKQALCIHNWVRPERQKYGERRIGI